MYHTFWYLFCSAVAVYLEKEHQIANFNRSWGKTWAMVVIYPEMALLITASSPDRYLFCSDLVLCIGWPCPHPYAAPSNTFIWSAVPLPTTDWALSPGLNSLLYLIKEGLSLSCHNGLSFCTKALAWTQDHFLPNNPWDYSLLENKGCIWFSIGTSDG